MISAFILIQTHVGGPTRVAHDISSMPGVKSAEAVTGPYDVIVLAEANDLDELAKLVVRRIQEVEGVTRTLTCPVVHL